MAIASRRWTYPLTDTPMLSETNDRIRHDLARAVIGDVAAAVAVNQIDILFGQFFGAGDEIPDGFLAAAQGDHGGMFDDEILFLLRRRRRVRGRVPASSHASRYAMRPRSFTTIAVGIFWKD